SPPMTLKRVDLPQPDGPITPTNSPGDTSSETPSTAVRTPSGVSKRLTMSSTTRIALADPTFGAPASGRSDGTAGIHVPSSPLSGLSGSGRISSILRVFRAGLAQPYSISGPLEAGMLQAQYATSACGGCGRIMTLACIAASVEGMR